MNRNEFMETFAFCQVIMEDLGIETGHIIDVKLNDDITHFGSTHRSIELIDGIRTKCFSIEINSALLNDDVLPEEMENTILHELIHTVEGCWNHGKEFHRIAGIVNDYTGLNIDTKGSAESSRKLRDLQREKYKYCVVCPECGRHYYYKSARAKMVKRHDYYICGACGHHGFDLEVIR